MKIEITENIETNTRIATLTFDAFEIENVKLDKLDRLLLAECEKSRSVADKLLMLECLARRIEEQRK